MDLNKIIIIGHTGHDAEVHTSKTNNEYVTCSVAVNKYSKDGNAKTTWFKCIAFNNNSEYAKTIKKGEHLCIEGEMSLDVFTKEDGTKVINPKLIISRILRLKKAQNENAEDAYQSAKNGDNQSFNDEVPQFDDELPF